MKRIEVWNFIATAPGENLSDSLGNYLEWVRGAQVIDLAHTQHPNKDGISLVPKRIGFQHPDGKILPYPPAPEGFVPGAYPIRIGTGDVTCYLAFKSPVNENDLRNLGPGNIPSDTLQFVREEWRPHEIPA